MGRIRIANVTPYTRWPERGFNIIARDNLYRIHYNAILTTIAISQQEIRPD